MSAPSRLEGRYRRVLRLLPASYRQAWEEEMVATFLETMESDDPEQTSYLADYGRPSWSEVASVVRLAVRLRVGTAGAPRYLAWGAALRIVALVGLLVHASTGAWTGIGFQLWRSGRIPLLPAPPAEWADTATPMTAWDVVMHVTGLVWLGAFLLLLFGHWTAARALAWLGLAVSMVDTIASTVDVRRLTIDPFALTRWTHLLVSIVLVLALIAFHPDAPAPRRRPWLVALPVAAGLTIAAQLVIPASAWAFADWSTMCVTAFVGAALVHLAVPARRRVVDWTHALALLGGAVLVQRLLTLIDYIGDPVPQMAAVLLIGLAEAGVVLALLVPLWRRTRQTLHRLAPTPVGGASW